MLAVELDRGKVEFTFQHMTYEPLAGWEPKPTKARTKCFLFQNGKVVAEAWAQCAINDNFSRSAGRKIALTRALRMSGLTKAERTAVWGRYFARDVKNKDYTDAAKV